MKLAPDKPQAYVGQAKVLLVMGRTEEAEASYDRLIVRQPGSVEVILQLATILLNHDHYVAAIRRFLQVLEQEEDSAIALSGLGRAYQALRKPELAKNYYEKAVNAEPNNSSTHYMLGTLLFNKGQVKEAEKCYNKALELDANNVAAYRDLGYLHLSVNRPSDAREQFQNAMALQPRNPDIIAALAKLEDQSGNLQVAYELLAPIVASGILHAGIGIAYADICHHFNQCHEAIDYLERILTKVGCQPVMKEMLHFALGKLYDRLGDYDSAFSHFELGNQQKPKLV